MIPSYSHVPSTSPTSLSPVIMPTAPPGGECSTRPNNRRDRQDIAYPAGRGCEPGAVQHSCSPPPTLIAVLPFPFRVIRVFSWLAPRRPDTPAARLTISHKEHQARRPAFCHPCHRARHSRLCSGGDCANLRAHSFCFFPPPGVPFPRLCLRVFYSPGPCSVPPAPSERPAVL